MERLFWIRIRDEEDLTVGSRLESGDLAVIGSDCSIDPWDVVVGNEIHPSKTGLLSSLNREEEEATKRFDKQFAALNDVK